VSGVLRDRGWGTRIVPHVGYGSPVSVRVMGRVVMSRAAVAPGGGDGAIDDTVGSPPPLHRDPATEARWWRDFIGAPAMHAPVRITLPDRVVDTTTDGSGLIDVTIRGHGFSVGRRQVLLSSPGAEDAHAEVLIIGTTQRFGVISDIDDTVISTMLPRPMIAAWNTFVREEGTRQAVPGMATLYRRIADRHPGIPFVYLSTGSWNIAPNLQRFLTRHGFPTGPMLLTDWGPTNTGWFRSGMAHKAETLLLLARDFPNISWLLVGDDGQHDPAIYSNFARVAPDRVRAIAIRQLTPAEQVLAHGTTTMLPEELDEPADAPTVAAPDGRGLLAALRGLAEPLA